MRALILTILLLCACLPGQSRIPEFHQAATKIVAEAEKLGVRTGVQVAYVRDKKNLVEHRAKEQFIPASNMKLFTAALVLEELGADYVFRTRFHQHGSGDKQVLRIDPGGNPLLLGSLNEDQGYFADLPARLAKQGLSAVSVYLDDRGWPGPARPESWSKRQWHKSYAAPTGPFVLDLGCITVFIQAADQVGQDCRVWLEPAGLRLPRRGSIETTNSKKKGSVYGASVDARGLYLSGAYYYKSPTRPFRVAAQDPREVYRSVLSSELGAGGIEVDAWLEEAPVDAGVHLFDLDRPLRPALEYMLRDSNNFMAEQCLRVVAKTKANEGSLAMGRSLLEKRYAGLAPRKGAWRVGDGSGLSRQNLTSPAQIVALLNRVHASKNRKLLMETLARSGVSGTMKNRLKAELRGVVVAKTGTINGVSALSGYVRCKSGKVAIFSILMNYKPKRGLSARVLRKIQDRLVTQIGLRN